MVAGANGFRVIKFTGYGAEYYVIERKFMWAWIRFSDTDFDTLERALDCIAYHTCKKEQVWP